MKIGTAKKQTKILSKIERLDMHIIVFSETKKKDQEAETIGRYIHIWSGVPKREKAAKGISILIKYKWENVIQGCQQINERILKIRMNIFGQPTIIV